MCEALKVLQGTERVPRPPRKASQEKRKPSELLCKLPATQPPKPSWKESKNSCFSSSTHKLPGEGPRFILYSTILIFVVFVTYRVMMMLNCTFWRSWFFDFSVKESSRSHVYGTHVWNVADAKKIPVVEKSKCGACEACFLNFVTPPSGHFNII